MNFRVDLEAYRGPLDLLLYLVRKEEVEIVDLPLATITDQFLAHIEVLEKLDIDGIGEFLEMAGALIELKSRLVLPHADEVEEPLDDPKQDLVRQLLEYKKFRDAASMLEDRARGWQEHFSRVARDKPIGDALADEPLAEVELWDLVSAFARIVRENQGTPQSNILYDDTPIHVHMQRIARLLNEQGHVALGELFEPGMQKSKLVGMFLAVLELSRHHSVKTEQLNLFGEILVYPGPKGHVSVDADAADDYDHPTAGAAQSEASAATATLEAPEPAKKGRAKKAK
ncbi:MAG: segregation/condensation protein A [Planctomycetaceae bacterium]|nr:segregation/condensation protein A [Planctomycetaceae bacterium]